MTAAETLHKTYDALQWQAQMGIDLCVEETPQEIAAVNASPLASSATNARVPSPSRGKLEPVLNLIQDGGAPEDIALLQRPLTQPSPARGEGLPSIVEAVAEARALADSVTTLGELEAAVRSFNGCALKKTATTTVFADGVAESRLMFIGEAPGAEEDRSGIPFCGASGQLLDRMLSFIGLNRAENFYITNTLFWRPPGNRQPTADELEICRPLVEKHIALVNPKRLVLVGGTAATSILRDTRGITRLRGQLFSYHNDYMTAPVPVHVIYHPSYLLRQPLAKKQAWGDLLALKQAMTEVEPHA